MIDEERGGRRVDGDNDTKGKGKLRGGRKGGEGEKVGDRKMRKTKIVDE